MFTVASPVRWVSVKRKCGDDSVYRIEGCGKTRMKINDTMPHTCNMPQNGVGTPIAYIQEMSAVRYPFILKTSTFSIQDLRKHFLYVRYLYNSIAKLKIIFETTTLFRDIAHILYNKLPNDAVILYGYIRNTAHIVILVWQN